MANQPKSIEKDLADRPTVDSVCAGDCEICGITLWSTPNIVDTWVTINGKNVCMHHHGVKEEAKETWKQRGREILESHDRMLINIGRKPAFAEAYGRWGKIFPKKKEHYCSDCFDTGCMCGSIGLDCHGCCHCLDKNGKTLAQRSQ
jgi:hypothetical protein